MQCQVKDKQQSQNDSSQDQYKEDEVEDSQWLTVPKKKNQILRHYVILLSQLELAYEKISPRVAPFALEPLYEMKAKTQDTTS